jgi:hypothetical protein
MAYGVNAPFGLKPLSSISGGTWVEKTNEYYIYNDLTTGAGYASSIFSGDLVIWNPTAASVLSPFPTIAPYTPDTATVANNIIPVLGVFVGCQYYSPTNPRKFINSSYWPANTQVVPGTTVKAYVIDDPDVVWAIQASTATNVANDARFGGVVNGPATPAYCGQNFAHGLGAGGGNLVPNNPVSGSTFTGLSGMYLNLVGTTATNRTNATLPLKVLGLSQNVDNDPIFEPAGGAIAPYTIVRQFLTLMATINNHVYRAGSGGTTPA